MAFQPVATAPTIVPVDGLDLSSGDVTVVMGSKFDLGTYAEQNRPVWFRQDQLAYAATLETLKRFEGLGVNVVVADGGSSAGITDSFRGFSGVTVFTGARPGLATQYVDGMAFALAHGARRIIRMEPFKYGVAVQAVLDTIIKELIDGTDFLEVGRDVESMATLPYVQRRTEASMGRVFYRSGWSFGFDALCGVRGFSTVGARSFVAGYEGWLQEYGAAVNNWLHLYVSYINAAQYRISPGAIVVPMAYDPAMTEYENGQPALAGKRVEQAFMQEEGLNRLFPRQGLEDSDTLDGVDPTLCSFATAYTTTML